MHRAIISTRVSATLNFTLSPTPRRLIAASSSMKPKATAVTTSRTGKPIQPLIARPPKKFWARTFADVEALVMPEQSTANATRKVTKWIPNALWV
jgi:hypothetical protein